MSYSVRAEQLWWIVTLVLIGLFAVTFILWMFDGRLIDRESVWAKPLKFEASLALHFATLALCTSLIGGHSKWGAFLYAMAIASIAATAFEMIYILAQAARQQASHFNLSTGFYVTMYVLMAIGAVVITIAAVPVALAVWLDAAGETRLAVRLGVAIGLVGGAVLTLVTAFRMGGALSHHTGMELANALRMPVTGWSLSIGDRRVPHFLATHMMQAVPLAGLVFAKILSPLAASAAVVSVSLIWIGATLVAFSQANMGLPLTKWPW